jgi:hypothetical protein
MEVSGQLDLQGNWERYPLYRRLGGPQSRSERCGVQKHLLPLPGIESRFLCRPARNPNVMPSEPLRLLGVYRNRLSRTDAVHLQAYSHRNALQQQGFFEYKIKYLSVSRQVHSLFQTKFSKECDLELPPSTSSIFLFP